MPNTVNITLAIPLQVLATLKRICRQAFEDSMDGLGENDILELELDSAKVVDIILDRMASGSYSCCLSKVERDIWTWMSQETKESIAHVAWCNGGEESLAKRLNGEVKDAQV